MNLPRASQLIEATPAAPLAEAGSTVEGPSAFGDALGEALAPGSSSTPRGKREGAHARHRPDVRPRRGPEADESDPSAAAVATTALHPRAMNEPHVSKPPQEQQEAGDEPLSAPATRASRPGPTPEGHGSGTGQGVVSLRPDGAQLAARLGKRPDPKIGAPAPGAARDAKTTAAERERQREKPRASEVAASFEPPVGSSRSEAPAVTAGADARSPRPAAALVAPARTWAAPPPGHDVGGAVLRNAAHLKVDAGVLGAIELHLRVRDGALHLRVSGEAAHLVETRTGELSRALAADGLKLAPVELPPGDGATLQSGGGNPGDQRREAWNDAAESSETSRARAVPGGSKPAPAAALESGAVQPTGSHIDVKA